MATDTDREFLAGLIQKRKTIDSLIRGVLGLRPDLSSLVDSAPDGTTDGEDVVGQVRVAEGNGAALTIADILAKVRAGEFTGQSAWEKCRDIMRKLPPKTPTKLGDLIAVIEKTGEKTNAAALSTAMRRQSTVFIRLKYGTWGLREWYPGAKAPVGKKKSGLPTDDANGNGGDKDGSDA